jgi:glycosyltransferase involved in cell wall biosynthesis
MRISIVTPTFQRVEYLNQTIESIVTQKGDFELEYIIQDGGSGAEVLDLLRYWENRVAHAEFTGSCKRLEFLVHSEPDNGMYEAINKGFSRATGDIMAWLNSDDMYHPCALQSVTAIFRTFPDIQWLTGIPNSFNETGSRTGFDTFPGAYSRKYLRLGYYDVAYVKSGFNWVQQESTFWRKSLWEKAGAQLPSRYRYAADFHLWREFARHSDLVKVYTFLGGFRVHRNQITADPTLYRRELPDIPPPPASLAFLKRLFDWLPPTRKLFFNRRRGRPFLNLLGLSFGDLTGRTVQWSFSENDWIISLRSIL